MTGNVLIKNRTPSSDVPYLFGLPKQKTTLLRRTSVLRSKTLAEGEFTSPEHFNFSQESPKRGHNLRCDLFLGAGDEARSQHCRAATRTAGDKRPTGAFSRFARALFAPLPAGAKKSALLRRTSVLRSKTLAEGEFTSPEHFNFLPESKKEVTTYVVTSFFGAGDEARTRYLHLGKVALYQMSYARGTRCTIPDIFRFVKHRF
mgnify:CR=1 FL=1